MTINKAHKTCREQLNKEIGDLLAGRRITVL